MKNFILKQIKQHQSEPKKYLQPSYKYFILYGHKKKFKKDMIIKNF